MANDEGLQQALKRYRLLAGLLGLLGAGLLVCGILAVGTSGSITTGLPYFLGGFMVGIMNLGAAAICTCIVVKAPNADNEVKRKSVGCAIQGQYFLAAFTIMACFIGCIFAGIGGIDDGLSSRYDDDDDDEEENAIRKRQILAVFILIGCILGLGATIFSMCTICTYSSYFGVVMRRNRRGKMVFINTGQLPGETSTTSNEMSTIQMTTSMPTPKVRNNRVENLQKENRLLQQQLDLQKQLFEQQQQQQQTQQQNQYSNVYPPPPPSYDVVYPPPHQ